MNTLIRDQRPRPGTTFTWIAAVVLLTGLASTVSASETTEERESIPSSIMRVAAAQPTNRTIDFQLTPSGVLDRVEGSLEELEKMFMRHARTAAMSWRFLNSGFADIPYGRSACFALFERV